MKKILIIEDDNNIASLERDYLEANGYATDIEHDGGSGYQKARTGDFDLILLDIMLPGMDGFEICREVRKEKDIPIILVTAKKEDIDKIRGLGLGADDYIVKPFSPSELVARVTAIALFHRCGSMLDRVVHHVAQEFPIAVTCQLNVQLTGDGAQIDQPILADHAV